MNQSNDSRCEGRNLDDLLNQHFAGRVVRKNLTKLVKEGANKYPGKTVEDGDLAGVPEPLASEVRHRSSTWDRAKIAEKMAKPIALAQKTGLSLATWDYKGGFGLRKRDGKPDQQLIDILMAK